MSNLLELGYLGYLDDSNASRIKKIKNYDIVVRKRKPSHACSKIVYISRILFCSFVWISLQKVNLLAFIHCVKGELRLFSKDYFCVTNMLKQHNMLFQHVCDTKIVFLKKCQFSLRTVYVCTKHATYIYKNAQKLLHMLLKKIIKIQNYKIV